MKVLNQDKIECPKCGLPMKKKEHILDGINGFIKITPIYRCNICNEEYYAFLKTEVKGLGSYK